MKCVACGHVAHVNKGDIGYNSFVCHGYLHVLQSNWMFSSVRLCNIYLRFDLADPC